MLVPPRLSDMKNVTSEEGRSTTLSCFVNAYPDATMKFKKPGHDFEYTIGKHVSRYVLKLHRISVRNYILIISIVYVHVLCISWICRERFCTVLMGHKLSSLV